MTTQFVGFAGKKQRGKNAAATIATRLLREAGYTVAEYAFAQTLKDMCINVFGLDPNKVYGSNDDKEELTHILWDGFPDSVRRKYTDVPVGKRQDGFDPRPINLRSGRMTYRELLQVMGTDIFREMVYTNVWSEAPFRQDWEGIDVVLLTDVRFPNETAAVDEAGGKTLRIDRSVDLEGDNHASETALDNYDFRYRYQNDGTLEDLECAVRRFLVDIGFDIPVGT